MYKIVSSRGGGRTTTLCEYAINNYVNIITPNDGRYAISIVHNKLKEKNFEIIEEKKTSYGFHIVWDIGNNNYKEIDIISVSANKDNLRGIWSSNCVVDDADSILRILVRENLKQNVVGLTMSTE